MTDNEIIKALECCTSWGCGTSCADCPLYNTGCLHFNKLGETLDLINRLQAEKEALIAGQETMSKYIEEQQAEIERLQKENTELDGANVLLTVTLQNAQTEAIKEFAERLIIVDETTAKYCEANEKVIRVSDIDNLVKEMVGEK